MEHPEVKFIDPKDRIKNLTNYGSSIEIDFNVPAVRYFRSGQEMTRMANLYLEEGNLEHAYILYIKFMTLFLEKIRKHPGYKTVPTHLKETIMRKLKDVMPIAEKLKKQLVEQYTSEHKRYLEELRKEQQKEKDKMSSLSVLQDNIVTSKPEARFPAVVPTVGLDTITYPDVGDENKKAPENNLVPSCSKPTVNRTTKPKSTETTLGDDIYSQYKSLKLVIVPSEVTTQFLRIANKNTLVNKETCGILAGIPKSNQFEISHLIIPKQTGTSDTCSATNEEELSEFINDNNLFSLGWIHTHPTQTAFLSAVDLHTQYSYQRLFDESIAIVCAPRYNENEIFTLTQDYGLPLIGKCTQTGFHTHPNEKPIYKKADHIEYNDKMKVEVVDLQ